MSEDILRRVRGLIAKANATEFEAERESFLAKADQLMEKYAIDQALLLLHDDKKAKIVERRDMDVSWYTELKGIDYDVRQRIHWLWTYCVTFCRCYTSSSVWNHKELKQAVYGMPSDLSYLELLFTDLFLQMSLRLKPKFDPSLSLGHNVYNAKNAGMKYTDIAIWAGRPEWVIPNGTGGVKTNDKGAMKRAYDRHLAAHHPDEERIRMHPTTWALSFMDGYVATIKRRFDEMQGQRQESSSNSMALAVRDIREQAREALFDDFPELRPHPDDCQCERCSAARKPVKAKRRATSYRYGRSIDWSARVQGGKAGADARIVPQGEQVRGDKKGQLPS